MFSCVWRTWLACLWHHNLTFTKKLLVVSNGIGHCSCPYCSLYIFRLIVQLHKRPWQSSQFYLLIWRRDLMERLCLMLTSIFRQHNLWHPFYDDVPLLVFVARHYHAVLCRRIPPHSFSSFVTLYFFVISVLPAEHILVDTFKSRSCSLSRRRFLLWHEIWIVCTSLPISSYLFSLI